jgi:hypothetical protein
MPEDASPGHCIATFTTAITYLAIELGTYFDLQMTAKHGHNWFALLEEVRVAANPKYRASRSCFDFSWIINEPARNQNSPIRDLLPKNEYQFYPTMLELLDARNRWFHDYNPHNINELSKALDLVRYISTKCALQLDDEIQPIIKRVREIKAGAYSSQPKPEHASSNPPAVPNQKPIRQSAVGAAWLGPSGKRKLQLSSSGSLIDLDAAKNVTTELTEHQRNRYLPLWKALGVDWLWVDELGSVAANVYGSMRMVGYLGNQADDSGQDPFAKFLLPTTYAIVDQIVIDRASQEALNLHNQDSETHKTVSNALATLENQDILRVTWDGDLIHFGQGGAIYLGRISSSEWFSGHFLTDSSS